MKENIKSQVFIYLKSIIFTKKRISFPSTDTTSTIDPTIIHAQDFNKISTPLSFELIYHDYDSSSARHHIFTNDDIIPFYYLQICEFSRLLVDDIIPFYHPQYHESQGCKCHEQK